MNRIRTLLQREQQLTPPTAAVVLCCALSGLATYRFAGHGVWQQWTVLLHIVSSVATTVLLPAYLYLHFRRTTGVRRISVLLSGLATLLLVAAFTLSGWELLVEGQREARRWVYELHVLSSLLLMAVLALHLLLHVILLPARRRQRGDSLFPSLPEGILRTIIAVNGPAVILLVAASLLYPLTVPPDTTAPAVANYEYPYGAHPFRPSQTETLSGSFVNARRVGNSHRCLNCHADIGRQWLASAHRKAAFDPTYVTNINLLEKKKGISATRYCEGCHAPVALLSGELSPGGKHGGVPGTLANREGVSCTSCHGIDALPHQKGVASFRFRPASDYLFAHSDNAVARRLNDLLIRVRPAQHKLDLASPLSAESRFCASCHTQFMDKDMNDWGWVKMQDEFSAWLASPYSRQHKEDFSDTTATRCQDCHMPLVASGDPSADEQGRVRSHHFPGANTLLPVLDGDLAQLRETRLFLQSNKMRVSIDKPSRRDALQTRLALDEKLRASEETPYYYYLGETASIDIVVSNRGVGHDFPGGTLDINQAWMEFLVMDAEGREVYSSGRIDDNNFVDRDAWFYRSLPVDRNGQLVWKHDLFNMVGESFRRVIKAGESDIVSYRFSIPAWVKSPLTLTARLRYRKLNERYARWALGDNYVTLPVIDIAWDSLQVPVRVRKEVEAPETQP